MSSLVCGLDVHKDGVYVRVMSYGGEVIDERKLSNDEVVRKSGGCRCIDRCYGS